MCKAMQMPKYMLFYLGTLLLLILEREEGRECERARDSNINLSSHLLMHSLVAASVCLTGERTAFEYGGDAVTNWAPWPGSKYAFKLFLAESLSLRFSDSNINTCMGKLWIKIKYILIINIQTKLKRRKHCKAWNTYYEIIPEVRVNALEAWNLLYLDWVTLQSGSEQGDWTEQNIEVSSMVHWFKW